MFSSRAARPWTRPSPPSSAWAPSTPTGERSDQSEESIETTDQSQLGHRGRVRHDRFQRRESGRRGPCREGEGTWLGQGGYVQWERIARIEGLCQIMYLPWMQNELTEAISRDHYRSQFQEKLQATGRPRDATALRTSAGRGC